MNREVEVDNSQIKPKANVCEVGENNTQTLKISNSAPVASDALKESKAETKSETRKFTVKDTDNNTSWTVNITGDLSTPEAVKQAVENQIKIDDEKQAQDLPPEILQIASDSNSYSTQLGTDDTSAKIYKDGQIVEIPSMKAAQEAWQQRKRENFSLAGYEATNVSDSEIEVQSVGLRYISLNVWQRINRKIIFEKYYGNNDIVDFRTITQDGQATKANPGNNRVSYADLSDPENQNTKTINPNNIAKEANSKTSAIDDAPKTDYNQLLMDSLAGRQYDAATGTIDHFSSATNNSSTFIIQFGKQAVSEYVDKRGQDIKEAEKMVYLSR